MQGPVRGGSPLAGNRTAAHPRRALPLLLGCCALIITSCSSGDDAGSEADPPPAQAMTPDATADAAAPAATEPAATDPARSDATATTDATPTDATPTESTPATTEENSQAASARCGNLDEVEGPVTLTVWTDLGGENAPDVLQRQVAEFETLHPDIRVELAEPPEGGWPNGVNALGETPVGERPDVILASELTNRLQADSGAFVPVEECTGFETPEQFTDLYPVIDETWRVDGTLWAAPYNVSTAVLMYDGNLWRSAGLDPDTPPTSIDELVDAIRTVRDETDAGTGIALYDRAAFWLISVQAAQQELVTVLPDNGHSGIDIDEVALDQSLFVETMSAFQELFDQGYVNWVGLNDSGQDDLFALVTPPPATSGMTLHTSASLGDIYRLQESQTALKPVEVRAAPFPGGGPGGPVGGGAFWLLDRGRPDLVEAGWLFVDWMTQPERVAEMAAETGYVPSTERAAASEVMAEAWSAYPALRAGFEQVAAASGSPAAASWQLGPQTDVMREVELAAVAIITEGAHPEDTLDAAEESALTWLDGYAELIAG